jgi:hypothetical protein
VQDARPLLAVCRFGIDISLIHIKLAAYARWREFRRFDLHNGQDRVYDK